jgi:GNAT superfamily N-acetyltransferase
LPRLCPEGQPYIGPTATLSDARRRGVGQALVDSALDWAHPRLSLGLGRLRHRQPAVPPVLAPRRFRPTGYGLLRLIDQTTRARPGSVDARPRAQRNDLNCRESRVTSAGP